MAQPHGSQRRILAICQRRGGVAWEFCCTRSCDELWRAMARRQASAPVIATVGLGTKGWLCGWSRAELCLRCEEGFGSKKLVTLSTTLVPRTPQLPRFTCGCSSNIKR